MTLRSFYDGLRSSSRAALTLPALIMGMALFAAACDRTAPTEIAEQSATRLLASTDNLVLVGFTSHPGAAEISLIQSLGGQITHQYKYIPVIAAKIPAAKESVLRATPGVAYVEADHEVRALYSSKGKQISDYGVRLIEAPAAWSLGFRGEGVKVGIFDSGVDLEHPDLAVAGGIDLVGDGYGFDDCNGHGTHVAGIVAAKDNGNHTVGVAPRATIYSMRLLDCEGSGSFSSMITGLEWAIDNGMQVVNMSFGTVLPTILSEAADAALQVAYDRGIVLVGASGNSSTPYVGYPASHPAVIAVGATDDEDMLASFSQWGTEQDLTAPGVNNLASYPVGKGQSTSLTVDTDNAHELEAIALAFAGKTRKQGLTADAIYAGLGTVGDYAGVNCTGKTAVVMRGGTSFAEKTEAAMNAGCAAIIIHNHTPGNFNGTLGTETASDGRAWIPGASVSLEEGLYLKDQIETRATKVTLLNVAGNLAMLSGTSMASPHAAGVATLVLSKNRSLSPEQVRTVLRQSSNDLGTPGWDPVFGHGRVNAKRAVEQTQ
ncbi:MAG: S8 family serine peptidase [Gemmatimonadetes bacterium]|nr:S8 family serine peptidase [Gemmatimonadota bacterium]